MNTIEFTLVVWVASFLAGLLGALTGLGGAAILVPVLTLWFHVHIHYAAGAALVSVIATSSGAAAAYVKEGYTNIRIGMFLEIATTIGAVIGAYLATKTPVEGIAIILAVVLLYSGYVSGRSQPEHPIGVRPDPLAGVLRMHGTYPTPEGQRSYLVSSVSKGFGLMFGAGTLSGLLGIGSGAVKVLALDQAMKLPFKVSTTTSNFMIGVTAAASAGVYLRRGYIDPSLAMPVMLGVVAGSFLGAKLLARAKTQWLRRVFAVVIITMALELIFNALTGRL
ncbi:MAG TPA: sulfite exporter TauE/SafE family protein [Candidatus Angelobacter sp.]|nr:sulfite exporter TauE/SafE family protein [Candidatus Angelobacter sp.]